ncbi:MAG: YbdK family carboxylate-amine ligase [Agitococcus sp.]|nr:YbdK family carboxylate-amine ligase [Agitococcus sp.]MDO9179465.1 YbdK family carboxylate-amine ligase [Agitococcus sp.]
MSITLGAEEELQIVSRRSLDLDSHDHVLALLQHPGPPDSTSIEVHSCTLEIKTTVCNSPDAIVLQLETLRRLAAQRACDQGQSVLSAGLHPYANWRMQKVHEDASAHPHYHQLLSEYQDAARGAMSFGLHVHVGLPTEALRIPVMNRLRHVLPLVMALSANAPFCEGRDTGLHSWRHSLLGCLPRMGIPEVWGSEAEYVAHVARLQRMGCIAPYTSVWEDLRLHHIYKTLEVRICDAHHSLDRVWLIVALLQAEAATLCSEVSTNNAKAPQSRMCLEENKWRARRYGLQAQFIDWDTETAMPVTDFLDIWLQRVRPHAEQLGTYARLERALARALTVGTGADEQRGWHRNTGDWRGVVRHLVQATNEPWVPQ